MHCKTLNHKTLGVWTRSSSARLARPESRIQISRSYIYITFDRLDHRRGATKGHLQRRAASCVTVEASDMNGDERSRKPSVVICGAGIIGSSIAYYLSLKGIQATIIERTGVACAASGKAGGFLALDWNDGSPTGSLARHSFKLHEELGVEFGERTGYRRVNTLALKTAFSSKGGTAKQSSAVKKVVPPWLDGEIASARAMATRSSTAQVHPEKLTNAFLEEAQRAGTRLRIGTVEGLMADQEGLVTGVRVDGNDVKADVVVIAMGPWTKRAAAWLEGIPSIGAQKAHSVILQHSSPVTADCLFLDHRTKQGKQSDPEVYPRPDGTVYICGESESVDPPENPTDIQPRATATAALQEVGAAISTSLADSLLLKEQACFLPLSPDGTPAIGPVPGTARSLYVASGHSCWGILNAPATGEAVAAMIAGEQPTIDMADFDPARFMTSRRFRTRR